MRKAIILLIMFVGILIMSSCRSTSDPCGLAVDTEIQQIDETVILNL